MQYRDNKLRPPGFDHKTARRKQMLSIFIQLMGWIGIAALYYVGFSFFFDTPTEYRLKRSTDKLRKEYTALSARLDSLAPVMENVIERDRNVFGMLFEAEPYDFDGQFEDDRWRSYEKLLSKNNAELGDLLDQRTNRLEKQLALLMQSNHSLEQKAAEMGDRLNYIPSIQPIINKDLTLLTASYGMRIHPFYKTLTSHQGVDYTVPEGSRVFATADGVVKDVVKRSTSTGHTVVINHGNGYETEYRHLSKINVSKGNAVRRGDIIALTGNTGLSLAPHLHYEIRHNGMRVDPVHYFFMELSPMQYQRMIKIAQSGMQSFD